MRPARKGPETSVPAWLAIACSASFNEAGPQGAGNARSAGNDQDRTGALQ